jgi:hypothetical protein
MLFLARGVATQKGGDRCNTISARSSAVWRFQKHVSGSTMTLMRRLHRLSREQWCIPAHYDIQGPHYSFHRSHMLESCFGGRCSKLVNP